MTSYCKSIIFSRNRPFWATQPSACGATQDDCSGHECGAPGLQLIAGSGNSRSIVTSDWLRSLVINMLYTDGRRSDTKCGFVPGTQGGHWSESFRKDGQRIGTLMRNIPASASIRDSIALIKARMVADLNRLVIMKIALSVDVRVAYIGGSKMQVEIDVIGQSGETSKVGLLGTRLKNAWVWA